MRQFDLQPSLGRRRALAEDFENQPCPVDDFRAQFGFQIALLDGAQRGVDNDKLHCLRVDVGSDCLDLSDADQRRGTRLAQSKRMHGNDIEPDREREALRFLYAGVEVARQPLPAPFGHDEQRGCAPGDFAIAFDHRVTSTIGQASPASPSASPLSVKLIGPLGCTVEIACLYTS